MISNHSHISTASLKKRKAVGGLNHEAVMSFRIFCQRYCTILSSLMLAVRGTGQPCISKPCHFILELFSLRVRMPTQCRTIVLQQGNEWFIFDSISIEGVGLFPSAFRARASRGAIGFRLWWKLETKPESTAVLGGESWLEEVGGGKGTYS